MSFRTVSQQGMSQSPGHLEERRKLNMYVQVYFGFGVHFE